MRIKPIDRHEKWFDIPNDPDKGRILIGEASQSDIFEVVNAAALRSARSEVSPESEYLREFYSRHILDWENILNERGELLPCTYENKVRVLNTPELFNVILTAVNEVRDEGMKAREEAEKN
ncbi:MAG: hypothetical protein LBR94_08875 [Desulfovibrio sp.]|jgi:hypothetical protein|nr:hypothetical protein [Desulfovibrio sp.]